jgi:hypothetical protein
LNCGQAIEVMDKQVKGIGAFGPAGVALQADVHAVAAARVGSPQAGLGSAQDFAEEVLRIEPEGGQGARQVAAASSGWVEVRAAAEKQGSAHLAVAHPFAGAEKKDCAHW